MRAAIGEKTPTMHYRLRRLVDGGLCRIYDTPSPGRPCNLSDDEKCRLIVCNDTTACGYGRDTWISGVLAEHVEETGQKYYKSGILKLASRMGYSVRVSRSTPK